MSTRPSQHTDAFAVVAVSNVLGGLFSTLQNIVVSTGVFIWDFFLAIFNLITPNHPSNRVVPQGYAGAGGLWPKYVPAGPGDSRCSCPALNAMANHGILPHDGKNITFRQLNATVRSTYNFAPSFCYFVPNHIATILDRSYWTGVFDLSDIDVHNGIEHDASLTREDSIWERDQGKVSVTLTERLLKSGTGPNGDLTPADLSRLLAERRAESKANNPQYSQALQHALFGSANSSTMLTIFGGKVADLRPFLLEERIPDDWQPRTTTRMGLTMAAFNGTVLPVELGIKKFTVPKAKAKTA
ncbi:hypothetical protein EIP91_002282 [Steccherinum ochraceum]|uniref:Heme haloperoxidase family profile domain-containing protein n=1 Tax=Steccherinum ochraceum TaxID=92696 RepID=A0A4R0REV8_9APHY|nr:hypothetical protein EIP91_002282 [Steccherinum ochraceum]